MTSVEPFLHDPSAVPRSSPFEVETHRQDKRGAR
jgi:hypothetical protein